MKEPGLVLCCCITLFSLAGPLPTRNLSCGVEKLPATETGINFNSLRYFGSSVDLLPIGLVWLNKMRSELNHTHTPMNCSTVR